MLEVILSESPGLVSSEAVRLSPHQPSTDAAAAPVAGLLCSWLRLAGRTFPLFNPSCKAGSSTVANFIRPVCVWPVLQDSVAVERVLYPLFGVT